MGTLTGRKKIKALTEGVKAQKFLEYLSGSGCNVRWAPSQPLTGGEGGDYIDVSGNQRNEDGAVAGPHTGVDGNSAGASGGVSGSNSNAPGSSNGAPIVDPHPIDGSNGGVSGSPSNAKGSGPNY